MPAPERERSSVMYISSGYPTRCNSRAGTTALEYLNTECQVNGVSVPSTFLTRLLLLLLLHSYLPSPRNPLRAPLAFLLYVLKPHLSPSPSHPQRRLGEGPALYTNPWAMQRPPPAASDLHPEA